MPQNREQIIADLYERISSMKRGMHSHMQAILQDYPVSHAQLELLFTIKHMQPVSFKQLAQQLYLTPGAVSQLADGLLSRAFITRKIDPDDRRIQCLHLTKKGEDVLVLIEKRRRDIMKQVMQSLTTEELTVWSRVQEKLITQFHNDNNKDPSQ